MRTDISEGVRLVGQRIEKVECLIFQIGGLVVIVALIAFLVMQRRKEGQNRATR